MFTPKQPKFIFTLDQCFHRAYEAGHVFRDVEIESVAKMLSCGTSKLGTIKYQCENKNCSHTKNIYATCKSKLCSSCGFKATEQWISQQINILPDCKFRHITFTMPDVFWDIFKLNRWLLNALFSIAASTLLSHAKDKGLTIGIFSALHTYGRKLNFNTHIHLSLAEFGIDKDGNVKPFSFPFVTLVKQWRYGIITLLRDNFSALILPPELALTGLHYDSWNNFLDVQYNRYWNVHIAKKTTKKEHTVKYLGRYLKKPPIGAARLAHYFGGDVTFEYLDHNTATHKTLQLEQTEMMLRLLSHVPEKHFKMIRYFGFLSNRLRGQLLPIMYDKLGQKMESIKSFAFAAMMKNYLNIDPYECILCGARMVFLGFIKGMRVKELVSSVKDISKLRI